MAIRRVVRESTHFLALISAHSVNKRDLVQKEREKKRTSKLHGNRSTGCSVQERSEPMTREDLPAPGEGFVLTHYLTASDVDCSRDFYANVLGGQGPRAQPGHKGRQRLDNYQRRRRPNPVQHLV